MECWMWIIVSISVFLMFCLAFIGLGAWALSDSITKDYEQFKKDGH